MKFDITQSGQCHGIGGWYEFFNEDECFLSTRPPLQITEKLWSNFLFPFESPIQLKVGNKLEATIEMHREQISYAPIWKWTVRLNGEELSAQSSFQAFMG